MKRHPANYKADTHADIFQNHQEPPLLHDGLDYLLEQVQGAQPPKLKAHDRAYRSLHLTPMDYLPYNTLLHTG